MSRRTLTYVCQNCGAASARWQGKCEACGEWNSMVEEGDAIRVVQDGERGSFAGHDAAEDAAHGGLRTPLS